MEEIDICGIGNGLVDVILNVCEEEFASLGVAKGSMRLVTREESQAILARFEGREQRLVSGGSAANSVIAAAELGCSAAFVTRLGEDRYGDHFAREFAELGVELGGGRDATEPTGTCLVLVTPDAERTMQTYLGASALVGADCVDEGLVARSSWVLLEGYLLGSPERGAAAMRRAVELAKKHGRKVAVTFSAGFIVERFGGLLRDIVEASDLVFANAEEAKSFTERGSLDAALDDLAAGGRGAAVTAGADGALVSFEGRRFYAPAYRCCPVDLTGAGDVFAGAFLAGIVRGIEPELAARGASYLAMKVILQVGARLWTGARKSWEEAVGSEVRP
ncbi:MAG: adenosine kinase [Planctomycetota bacterium]